MICAVGIGDETLAPEFEAGAAIGRFVADAVRRGDVAAVGDRVAALDGLPRIMLPLPVLRLLGGMPADGGGVEKNLRTAQRGEARRFGIPLIPADADANGGELRPPREEAEIARREVEFLVVERVVRDVHLAILAKKFAVRVDDRGGIVIKPGVAALEERGDDDHAASPARSSPSACVDGPGISSASLKYL